MNSRCRLLVALMLLTFSVAYAQQVTISAGSKWNDALLRKSNLSSESSFASTGRLGGQRLDQTNEY
jgi:hypothetical protein